MKKGFFILSIIVPLCSWGFKRGEWSWRGLSFQTQLGGAHLRMVQPQLMGSQWQLQWRLASWEANISIGDYYLQDRFLWKLQSVENIFGFRSLFFQYQSEFLGLKIGVLPSAFDQNRVGNRSLWIPHFREELGLWSHVQEGISLFWHYDNWWVIWQTTRPHGYSQSEWVLWTEGVFRYVSPSGWHGSLNVQSGRVTTSSPFVQQKLSDYGFLVPLGTEIRSRLVFGDFSYVDQRLIFEIEHGFVQWINHFDQDQLDWWRVLFQWHWSDLFQGPLMRYHHLRPDGDLKKGHLARLDIGYFFEDNKRLIHAECFVRQNYDSIGFLMSPHIFEFFVGVRFEVL